MSRRHFLQSITRRLLLPGLLASGVVGSYAMREAKRCKVHPVNIALRNLPAAFDGTTIAFLSDMHHGLLNPGGYLESVVAMTNDLRPDIVALGGDYVERRHAHEPGGSHRGYVRPGVAIMGGLRAPMGRFAVLGNHDYAVDAALTSRALADNGLTELTNDGVWLERGGARLRIGGVDDCRRGRPRLSSALGDMTMEDAAVVLTHNPDFVERIRDPRVDLVLSGHTHGGQVVLPFVGALATASVFGQKYVQGLRQGPMARVFVTRGVGTTGLPIRFACPPEVVLITLRQPVAS